MVGRQVSRRFREPNRADKTLIREATVSNKPDHRGEHVISRKVHYAGDVGCLR
jgi:hypothetical protein